MLKPRCTDMLLPAVVFLENISELQHLKIIHHQVPFNNTPPFTLWFSLQRKPMPLGLMEIPLL